MKMIASTKLARAQRSMETARKYGNTSTASLKFMIPEKKKAEEGGQEGKEKLIIACTSDKGLCGAIHSTISKPVRSLYRKNPENLSIVPVGDKVKSQIAREARQGIKISFSGVGRLSPTFSEACSIADLVLSSKSVDFSDASVYFNSFVSVLQYNLKIVDVLSEKKLKESPKIAVYELEDDVLKSFTEFCFGNTLYQALVEGHASEMAARRNAMENATKNAGEMINKLTITFNRQRQAKITGELVEIITGASAL
jgi:F-type H+-transporting ATPase subunit gamma